MTLRRAAACGLDLAIGAAIVSLALGIMALSRVADRVAKAKCEFKSACRLPPAYCSTCERGMIQ